MAKHKKQSDGDPIINFIEGFFGGIWSLVKMLFGTGKNSAAEQARPEFQRHWQAIQLTASHPHGIRQAIMQADILLDKALQVYKIPGNTLGERLKAAKGRMTDPMLDRAWSAHKVRNNLAHELHFQLSDQQGKQVLQDFQTVLKAMNLL